MQVTFRAKSSTLTAVFTAADVSISAAFGDRDGRFYAMLGRCYEDEQVVARSELLRAALALRESFERQSHRGWRLNDEWKPKAMSRADENS